MSLNKIVFYLIFILLIYSYTEIYGQKESQNKLSGNLYIDAGIEPPTLLREVNEQILSNLHEPDEYDSNAKQRKSPLLAGILSGILPGSGEFYSGQYLKAAIFLTIEAASITTAEIYNHKGNYQTSFFEWYNNQHWSVVRYAQWTLNNAANINPSVNTAQFLAGGANQVISTKNGVATGVNWGNLNLLESELGTDGSGSGYSHELAVFGSQDFYEITGKYPQFVSGWDTFPVSSYTDYNSYLLPQMLWYAHQRGIANSLYQTASFFVGVIYVNHFLSIIDAVWSTHNYNSRLAMNVSLQNINFAGGINISPTLKISYNL